MERKDRPLLKKKLRIATECTIQHNGWPCGTCFYWISKKLKNSHWQAVLAIRGDYPGLKLDSRRKKLLDTVLKLTDECIKRRRR